MAETKHFRNTMKFIDTVNKPIQKIAKKTTNKLTTFKKDIVKKVEKKTTPPTVNKNVVKKAIPSFRQSTAKKVITTK